MLPRLKVRKKDGVVTIDLKQSFLLLLSGSPLVVFGSHYFWAANTNLYHMRTNSSLATILYKHDNT